MILGIDTATLACSAALLEDETLRGEITVNVKKTHSQQLMPLIDYLLKSCLVEREQLTGIAVAAGPGSFTGIRIGVSTARGLAQGLAIPVVGVSTLEALAEGVTGPGTLICPLLDARRGEVYGALYLRQAAYPYLLEEIVPPSAVALPVLLNTAGEYKQPIVFLGEGISTYGREITETLGSKARFVSSPAGGLNRAGMIAWRGRQLLEVCSSAAPALPPVVPIYLRRPEAERRLKGDNRCNGV